ncbi:GGDEF domain-containing protein [Patescibacteria group bacterium]|nr:GGDEF domain-containing protein [Patescibacteria group bacterium]MBU1683054.1 GGDEF domain-containing protein [Patescibacteria group bacterium]
MCQNWKPGKIRFGENRLIFFSKADRLGSGETDDSDYEGALRQMQAKLNSAITGELERNLSDNAFFGPNEDNRLFVTADGDLTPTFLNILTQAARQEIAHVRKRITDVTELTARLEDDFLIETLIRDMFHNIQALIYKARHDTLMLAGGYSSLMEGFVDCKGTFGAQLYGEIVVRAFEEMQETREPASLLFIDLDKFKPVNDQFGHDVGDETLRYVGKLIMQAIRGGKTDDPIRFSGEELGILMRSTTSKRALYPAERIRYNLERNPLLVRKPVEIDEDGAEKAKGNVARVRKSRFIEIIKNNGIEKVEIGEGIRVPKYLKNTFDGLHGSGKEINIEEAEGGRGIKLILPDQREPESENRIVLIYIPLTASIGVAEFTTELLEETEEKMMRLQDTPDIEEIRKLLEQAGIEGGKSYLTEDENNIIQVILDGDERKLISLLNGESANMLTAVKERLRNVFVKTAFNTVRSNADEQTYIAKKGGRNCIARKGRIVDAKDITGAELMSPGSLSTPAVTIDEPEN